MWVICSEGFFNIVCQDDDEQKGLLTVKARSREDLENFISYFSFVGPEIEESHTADYQFRFKAPRQAVMNFMFNAVNEINYPKTKPKLAENRPDRANIYLRTWAVLQNIQYMDEKG